MTICEPIQSARRTCPVPGRHSCHREPLSDDQLGLAQDKVFRNALKTRRTGIIMASVGLSLGLLLIGLGACLMHFPFIGAPVIGLGISFVSTAGLGALFWWDGQSTMDEMRAARSASPQLIPKVSAAVGTNGGGVNASWQF